MSLDHRLWQENEDLARAAREHPFVCGIADGTLPQEAFARYVAQDAFFLHAFGRAYETALDASGDDAFGRLRDGVRDELRLHASYAERWGVDLSDAVPLPATAAYVGFLLESAPLGAGSACAAMTPCMRLYAHLGQSLDADAAGAYGDWVRTYASVEFEELAATLERLLARYGDDDAGTRATYRRAMEFELAFFDAAFRHEAGGG